MNKKKYLLSAALMLGAASGSWAQLGGVHNYMDSSYIPARRMAQQNEWRNNSKDQNFPSRPRDMWQVGVTGGLFMIDGDVPALPGWNAGINIRKAIGYVVSLRGSLTYGEAKGLDYRQNRNYGNAPELSRYNGASYVANFKTQAFTPTLEALVSLNNIMFHSKQNKLNVNVGVGYSPFIYKTMMNLFNANNQPYNYSAVTNFAGTRKEIRRQINNVLDDSYETPAVVNDRTQNFDNGGRGRYNFRHSWLALVGAEYRLSNKISLGFDFKYLFTHDDYIDGWRYQGGPSVQVLTSNPDNAIFTNLSLNFNLGSNKKRTAPLWWINPLDYVYGETNNPVHTKFPPQVLPDADDDGVTDQFDVEPNTPAGAPVDVRGKARDTDGDGVPDFRDKELITPTSCQPVDADGVGKCPCPDSTCFAGLVRGGGGPGCGIGDLPSVRFAGNSARLSNDAKAILASAADKMKANPNCVVGIMSYGEADKRSQQMSWDKANTVRNYLVQSLGISADRLVFKYGQTGSSDTVDLMDVTGQETPNTVPARPEYRRTN